MKIRTREELVNYVNRGKKVKYLFFWGHQIKGNAVSKSCFSQWYTSPFNDGENRFATAEHYMMHGKAKLFGDTDAMEKALQAKNPGAVKANLAKFSSNDELKAFLINTGKRVLVEASLVDKIWGIGLAEDNDAAQNPNLWKGENLLGFALMEVREQLQNSNG